MELKHDEKCSYSKVRRVMKENNLLLPRKKNPHGITKTDRRAEKSEDLIKRDFSAVEPNRKWLTDITEVECLDGKLYISPVMDCFDGLIVGLAMANHMKKELCMESLENACKRYVV